LRQSGEPRRFSLPATINWAGAWLAVFALALWMRHLSLLWLGVAAVGAAAWLLPRRPGLRWWRVGAALALGATIAVALGVQLHLREIARDWPLIRVEVEEQAAEAIGRDLDDLVDRGERAVEGVARIADALPEEIRLPTVFSRLEALRRTTDMSALAVYGPDGNPVAWAGEHRGMIPEPVRRGEQEYVYHQGPLFGYLYFAHPIAAGRTAVAAVLLDSSIPPGTGQVPFAQRFLSRHGIEPRFMPPERAVGEAVWDWATDRPILSVAFVRLTQEVWHHRAANRGRWVAAGLWLLAVLVLVAAWYRHRQGAPGIPIAVLTLSLFVLPLGAMLEARRLFSPLHFVLPAPGDVTLGQLLVLAGGAALWLLVRPPTGRALLPSRVAFWLRIGVAAALVPTILDVVQRSASLGLLASRPAGGFSLVFATTLLLAVPLFVLLLRPATGPPRRSATLPAVAGVLLAAGLAYGLVLVWHPERTIPIWLGAAWAVPFALCCVALARLPRGWGTPAAWLLATWLGGTAATGYLWTGHLGARIEAAEAELALLGTEPDPLLEYLLDRFAQRVYQLDAEGETGVDLLYRGWVTSELARQGYEARLTKWRDGQVDVELRFSELELDDDFTEEMLARGHAAEQPLLERYVEREGLHYLLLVPLPGDQLVSVATPPRRRLGRATALARFLHPETAGVTGEDYEALTLIPVFPGPAAAAAPPELSEVRWLRTRVGWRSETLVHFPAGPMHAHLQVDVPSPWILLLRGLLVQFLLIGLLGAWWALARTLCGEPLGLAAARWYWIRTFRGRLTLALFGFFLLPTLALGAVAYHALSQQVVRTGAALSLRSLELAAPEVTVRPLQELGERVRADLLFYWQGGLAGASAPGVIELGLFQTWLPPSIELAFATGEELEMLEERRIAGNRYLVAYRRIGDDGVLAAPTPLATGEIARMQREFAHGFLLMMILGAALSVVLALLVGRALSRPIELLSRATAAVGGGNLRLRLPEDRLDEFGGVYRAFNRMVRRLRRARADEVRTARVLAWGEMARQVAHEIKNPLTPIKLSVQHLRRAFSDRRPDFERILDRNVEAILREIDRLSQIARAFARFGAPSEPAGIVESIDLGQVVTETLVLYRGGKDGISYRTEIDPEVTRVRAREGELREVLLNLLENAREALDGEGAICISATPAGGGEWVRLEVRDTGDGIPPEMLPRIFEPQFSTRTSGTGLGLAIVRRLVESWGGEISADSEPGQGTTIHLRLRAAEPSPPSAAAAKRDGGSS
jgi:signal transduction histidine kinase